MAARYRPAEDTLSLGGDWFDMIELADEAVALAVGDVVGKGLGAAAVMGQLRSALSAATHGTDGPRPYGYCSAVRIRGAVGAVGRLTRRLSCNRAG